MTMQNLIIVKIGLKIWSDKQSLLKEQPKKLEKFFSAIESVW